jgi:hypothetical protein
MAGISARLAGVELYFDDVDAAKQFYTETIDLQVSGEDPGHYAKFEGGASFLCVERKGSESYPSRDKAALFFEVRDLQVAIAAIGQHRFVRVEKQWAVLHDPEVTTFSYCMLARRRHRRISPDGQLAECTLVRRSGGSSHDPGVLDKSHPRSPAPK